MTDAGCPRLRVTSKPPRVGGFLVCAHAHNYGRLTLAPRPTGLMVAATD